MFSVNPKACFGQPPEAELFFTTYANAPTAIDHLYDICEKVFIREGSTEKPSERLGFFLGRTCVEEFSELALLAINGYGIGALKILRTMYERAIHAAYLLQHPTEAELFLNYHVIHKRKALIHLGKIRDLKSILSEGDLRAIEDEFNRVKADYTEVVCNKCGKTRTQGSWSKLDLASMANKVGNGYGELYYDCYYKPTLQTHTTVTALEARMTVSDTGVLTSKDGAQRKEAMTALVHGHNLLLKVLETQNDYFQLGLEKEIEERTTELKTAYKPTPSE